MDEKQKDNKDHFINAIEEKGFSTVIIKDNPVLINLNQDYVIQNNALTKAFNDTVARNQIRMELAIEQSRQSFLETGEANPCFNLVCPHCISELNGRTNFCDREVNSYDCLFKMSSPPPNSLNYSEYMPSHQEALDRLESNNLLSGQRAEYALENVKYNKATTQEDRWNTEVKGITLHQAELAFITSLESYCKFILEEDGIDITDHMSISVVSRNACIELEKAMGIFPNIK